MKLFILMSSLFLSLTVSANEASFVYTGAEQSKSLTVNDSVYHTEYRLEQRADICYRTIVIGQTTVCRSVQVGTTCTTRNGQRICQPVYQRQCHQEPVYRRQAYTCYRTVQVPYTVFDYYTQANVSFNFSKAPANVSPSERITVSLDGNTLKTKVKSSGKVIMLYNKQENSTMSGNTQVQNVRYNITLIDLNKALSPGNGGIKLIDSSADQLVFESGSIPSDISYNFKLKLTRVKFLARDPVLVETMLNSSAIEFEPMNGRTIIKVKLDKLNAVLEKGKYKARFEIDLNTASSAILNTDVDSVELKMKKKFKIK